MTELTSKHYNDLLADNPNASFGFMLAARAVYATKFGIFNIPDGSTPKFKRIALNLANKYGEMLTTAEVRSEMRIAAVNKIHN